MTRPGSARPRRVPAAVVFLAVAAAACGDRVGEPEAQWLVTVHTDAPVPQLGDRLLVEVSTEEGALACSGCRRLFGVRNASSWPLSFGIPDPRSGRRLRLRVRLFRTDHTDAGGEPTSGLTIDDLASLPDTLGGVRRVATVLRTDCAGVPADLPRGLSCEPNRTELVARELGDVPSPPLPGSFELAAATPCFRPVEPNMVCIEGGLFARGSSVILEAGPSATPERLVRLSPFAIDRSELTVREMRELVLAKKLAAPVAHDLVEECTYTSVPGRFDRYPVNCVSRALAITACAARGARLPTEAEWEFAAGGRDEERRYPWGDDANICAHAVVGRGRIAPADGTVADLSTACRPREGLGPWPWGPAEIGSTDDVTALGVMDMGGNVGEWVADAFATYDAPCNEGPRILHDPRCASGKGASQLVRGGSWNEYPLSAETARRSETGRVASEFVGFRCAESM